ncbi:hypothetical protein OF83DRAFT_1019563, partial [Amylostereum chailletii]
GDCVMQCPMCPHPDINLPNDWEQAPRWKRFIYRLIMAINANFRMKNCLRSSELWDPSFNLGASYMVKEDKYQDHLKTSKHMTNCSKFATLAQANAKSNKGLRVTGAVGVMCMRHKLWLKLANLQKGKRYCNIDYVVSAAMEHVQNTLVLLSYDVACAWSKNMRCHLVGFHTSVACGVSVLCNTVLTFCIPKMHIKGHQKKCEEPFGFNYQEGTGSTDGKGIERGWSFVNGAAASTKEMGPGARHDTVDDRIGHANWKKVIGL